MECHPGKAPDVVKARRRDAAEHAQLTRLEEVHLCVLIGDDPHDHARECGRGAPEVSVRDERHVIVARELRHRERARPDRLQVKRRAVDLVARHPREDVPRYDRRTHHLLSKRRVRLLQMKHDRIGRRRVDARDLVEPGRVADVHVFVGHQLPSIGDVGGGERLTVRPVDARTQTIGPREPIRTDAFADRERGLPRAPIVHAVEAVENEAVHLLAVEQTVQVWIQAVGVIGDDRDERTGSGLRGRESRWHPDKRRTQPKPEKRLTQ